MVGFRFLLERSWMEDERQETAAVGPASSASAGRRRLQRARTGGGEDASRGLSGGGGRTKWEDITPPVHQGLVTMMVPRRSEDSLFFLRHR
jgi:hypothetical protein